jgi:hypothetical protein
VASRSEHTETGLREGNGRGERTRAYTFQISVTIVDGSGAGHVRRTSGVAQRERGVARMSAADSFRVEDD